MKHTVLALGLSIATMGSLAHADAHDARVRAYILDTRGDVDGLLLSDHATVRFGTMTGQSVTRHVRVGDRVEVSRDGMTLATPRDGWSVDLGMGGLPVGGGPSFAPPIARHERVGSADGMTVSGGETGSQRFDIHARVAGLSYTRGRMIDGLLLEGGISVRVPASRGESLAGLHAGDSVHVVGTGVRGSHGIGLRAEQIESHGAAVYAAE